MTDPQYVAYFENAHPVHVLTAEPRFPRRATLAEVRQDVLNAWHKPSKEDLATHLIPYQIDADGTVTPLQMRVHRNVEIHR